MNISEEKKFGLVFFIIFSAFMYLAYYKSNINLLIIFSIINAFLLLSILFKDKLLTGLMRRNAIIKSNTNPTRVLNSISRNDVLE